MEAKARRAVGGNMMMILSSGGEDRGSSWSTGELRTMSSSKQMLDTMVVEMNGGESSRPLLNTGDNANKRWCSVVVAMLVLVVDRGRRREWMYLERTGAQGARAT